VKAFQRIEKALDEGVEGVDDEDRMRDLAYLSMARTYYSSSITLDAETNAPTVNSTKLSAAVKYWNNVDKTSEYWLDALFEESWAYFMAGDYPRSLGNIHTLSAPYFPNSFYPESEVLRAIIYFTNCNYDAATTVVARFNLRYTPIKDELEKILKKYKGENREDAFFKFLLEVREGKGDIPVRWLLCHKAGLPYVDSTLTLDEALEASLLLHVVDASDPSFLEQLDVTRDVLREIGAEGVPHRLVMNKIDQLTPEALAALQQERPDAWFISAKNPEDVKEVRSRIIGFFESRYAEAELSVPYDQQRLVSEMHEQGRVVSERYEEDGVKVLFRSDPEVLDSFRSKLARLPTEPQG